MPHPPSRVRGAAQTFAGRTIESLESRIAPAFTGIVSGNTAAFIDQPGASTNLTISVAGGTLHHNQPFAAGTAGAFNSDIDFDSAKPGDQMIDVSSTYGVSILASGDDQITLGDLSTATSTPGTFLVE